ncbi:MAG TPA: GNAT family N-acetyltransferase [Anaeromyxobacteraceae bacterium]|nr:GNAT family N-acetyltransferase [Anaeromyxobacteraceae bacterium]
MDAGELSLDGPRLRAVLAGPEHGPVVQACLDAAPDYFERTEGRPAGPGAGADLVADAEADPARRLYLLEPRGGGPAVGVLDLHLDYPEPGVAHIGLLLFRESCQGMGYGKETTAAVEATLARSGFRALRLSVTDENQDAHAFWARLGFAAVGRLDRGVTVYEKPLEPAAR